jgi:autotransporter-associated beta strand protein
MRAPRPFHRRSIPRTASEDPRSSEPRRSWFHLLAGVLAVLAWAGVASAQSSGNRVLGLDVSAWQGNISQTTWNNLRAVENRQFVFMRATRGGTTGFDKRAGGYPASDNKDFNLSQRYDDPYFVQNMNRATAAGMFAGSYHFARPEIVASSTNSGGIPNNAFDEADHYMQMAGAFMRPGYLSPTFDLESGSGVRTNNELAQYAIDFSNRIYQTMQIRPMMYLNGNYAQNVLAAASAGRRDQLARPAAVSPSLVGPAYSQLWIARYPNPSNPGAINVQTGNPSDSISWVYGPWDDYGRSQPWTFWQYADTGRLNSFNNGNSNLDFNVANGGIEFLKDQLVPAVWWNDTSGDWSTLSNWNSGQPVIAPIRAPDQLAPIGTQTLPTPRLPGAAGSGPTSGQHDTVILDRPNANITVTLSTGSHNIRKFYVRETFRMTGGSLNVNYVPSADSTPMSMQISSSVSLSGGASLSAHTIHVDATRTLAAADANLTFDTLTLDRGSRPATLALNGDVAIAGSAGATATIGTNSGTSTSGRVDLGGGNRTITVANGPAMVDLRVLVPVTNGGLSKAGSGTMQLTGMNTYAGPTTVLQGSLMLGVNGSIASSLIDVRSGATLDVAQHVGGYATGSGQTLGGSGTVMGSVVFGNGATISPGAFAAAGSGLLQPAAVPEPSAFVLVVLGLGVLGFRPSSTRSRQALVLSQNHQKTTRPGVIRTHDQGIMSPLL